MASEKGNPALAGTAVTAAILLGLLASRKVSAAPPEGSTLVTLDDPAMQALVAILAREENINIDLGSATEILQAVNGNLDLLNANISALLGLPTLAQNPTNAVAWRTICPAILTAVQLPSKLVPRDTQVAIKALPTNGGVIYVATNAANATNPNSSYPLIANEAIMLKIRDTSLIWIAAATAAGDGVACVVEQEV